jgi:hypothetical protein
VETDPAYDDVIRRPDLATSLWIRPKGVPWMHSCSLCSLHKLQPCSIACILHDMGCVSMVQVRNQVGVGVVLLSLIRRLRNTRAGLPKCEINFSLDLELRWLYRTMMYTFFNCFRCGECLINRLWRLICANLQCGRGLHGPGPGPPA